jgi:site-specific DNA recombinase
MTNQNIAIEEVIKDVAIYLRKSRGDIDKDLIKHLTIMKEVCEKYNWRYVIYEEIGSGSTIKDRPKMQELMSDLEEDMFDAVLVVDFDRLGRGDEEDQGVIKKHLLKTDTLIVECSPYKVLNLYNEHDMQVVDFKGFLARQEYNMITKRLTRGKKIGAKLGNWTNGIAPFPYDYDGIKKGLIINEEKYRVYREMIERLFKGESLMQIANYLNSISYPSPRSNYTKQKNAKWHGNTIGSILRSEVHLGKIISNKTKYNKYKEETVAVPQSDWVVIENCHKPTKTIEEHEKIISIIDSNKKSTNVNQVNIYTGIIKCYQCENTLHIQKRKNGKYSVRKCANCGMQGGDCEFVMNLMSEMLINMKNNVVQIVDELEGKSNKEGIKGKLDKIISQLKELDEDKERIYAGYIGKLYSLDKAKELAKPTEKKIEMLNLEVDNLEKEMNNMKITDPKMLRGRFAKTIDILKNTDEKKVNAALHSVFNGVLWNRDKDDLEVYFEIKWT